MIDWRQLSSGPMVVLCGVSLVTGWVEGGSGVGGKQLCSVSLGSTDCVGDGHFQGGSRLVDSDLSGVRSFSAAACKCVLPGVN